MEFVELVVVLLWPVYHRWGGCSVTWRGIVTKHKGMDRETRTTGTGHKKLFAVIEFDMVFTLLCRDLSAFRSFFMPKRRDRVFLYKFTWQRWSIDCYVYAGVSILEDTEWHLSTMSAFEESSSSPGNQRSSADEVKCCTLKVNCGYPGKCSAWKYSLT